MQRPYLLVAAGLALALGATAGSQQTIASSVERDQRLRGFVVPSQQVELVSPIEEILARVDVAESQRVERGQLLAVMDDRLQRVVVEASQVRAASTAEMDRARLEIQDARITQERISTAYDRDAANELEKIRATVRLGQAEAAYDAALESHKLAEVNLRLEQERLARYEVRAPFDGTIIEILSDPGSMLHESDRVLVMAHLDTLEAHLNLPVEMYGALEVGRDHRLIAEHPVQGMIDARLITISPIIDTASRTFRCVFTIENADGRMPAGFTVYLDWPSP